MEITDPTFQATIWTENGKILQKTITVRYITSKCTSNICNKSGKLCCSAIYMAIRWRRMLLSMVVMTLMTPLVVNYFQCLSANYSGDSRFVIVASWSRNSVKELQGQFWRKIYSTKTFIHSKALFVGQSMKISILLSGILSN